MTNKIKTYAPRVLLVLALGVLAVFGITYRNQIYALCTDAAAREGFIAAAQESGWRGLALFFGGQILQVLVAVLPGEPFEIIAGALYGWLGGLLVCIAGLFCGTVLIYYTVKLLGAKRIPAETLHRYRFLRDSAHIKTALFLLFFIPGTPKDMLAYLGPLLPVPARTFFIIATLARIPSIVTSTIAGDSLAHGNWLVSVAVFAVTGGIALTCILLQDKLLAAIKAWQKKHLEKHGRV